MTLAEVGRLRRYWGRHPPTHVIAAAFAGFKPNKAKQGFSEFIAEVEKQRTTQR